MSYEFLVLFLQVEGQDLLVVREATKWCADYIRSGKVTFFDRNSTSSYSNYHSPPFS